MKFKVREHFFVHLNDKVYEPGTELELTAEQAERHATQIEPLEAPKPAKKAKADGAQ